LVTLALYWPATGFGFINCDDPDFVTANVHVQGGLNWEGLKWAFGLSGGDYWHPLTWLSLMLDMSLFGQKAGGFHFTNLMLHTANGVLVFLLLRVLTGAMWRSLLVAALFALHPLRVESVAWVTERKDVLSGFFGLLALIFYAHYAARGQRSEVGGPGALFPLPSSLCYLLSLGFFACGLMSKAMLVTWPLVMLLLDYWPLGRMQKAEGSGQRSEDSGTQHATRNAQHRSRFTFHVSRTALLPLLFEKIPFFVLSGISCVLTYVTEGAKPEVSGFVAAPALLRLQNALVAYARYLGKSFWPADLAVPYMNPSHWSWLEVGGAVLVGVGGGGLAGRFVGRAAAALPAGGLVLVYGDLDPGDRFDQGLGIIHGGSVHIFAVHWGVAPRRVGRV
jgi:hypothetical protein